MSVLALFRPWVFDVRTHTQTAPKAAPKDDWPLMGDVATFRADVPEMLIHWRKARGETPPVPLDNMRND